MEKIFGVFVLAAIGIATVLAQTPAASSAQSSSTTPGISDDRLYLDFAPEYVALLGMGIAFFLLFITVIVIICMTAKGGRRK